MANVTTLASLALAQWKRGTGYYGAHKHSTVLSWYDFRDAMDGPLETTKARYVYYLVSWVLHHSRTPDPNDIGPAADKIMLRVTVALDEELNNQERMKGAKRRK